MKRPNNLGYARLTNKERRWFNERGYVLDSNIHGDEIAARPSLPWYLFYARPLLERNRVVPS
jgi:hypothetical protein